MVNALGVLDAVLSVNLAAKCQSARSRKSSPREVAVEAGGGCCTVVRSRFVLSRV